MNLQRCLTQPTPPPDEGLKPIASLVDRNHSTSKDCTPVFSSTDFKMARKGRFTKKSKFGPGFQQPQGGANATSDSHHDGSEIHPNSGDSVPASGDSVPATSRPFRPPRNEETLLDEEVDNLHDASGTQIRRGRKTTEFWAVRTIDSDGTIKPAKLSVREAMKRPNGRKIVLRFNNAKQAIGDEAGVLSGVLGLLGSDFGKFPICRTSWREITTKDKVYNECVKQIFHFDEDSEGLIKKNILKSMGKSWKKTRLRLYDRFYEPTFTTEQNLENRPPGIDREHWRWYLDYRAKPETKEKCKKNAVNRSKQQYTHTGGSKSFARRMEEESEEQGKIVGRGELWIKVHKKKDGSYINDEARAIGERIEEIEQQDESSRMLSQNDSIAQVFEKEKLGRVRGMGSGPTPSQLFGPNSHAYGNGVQQEETQRKLLELQAELEGEKLKRKAMEDEAASDKKKLKAMESALIYLFQRQGEELPPEIAAGMSFVE
ncbi:hypothetical protein Ahy_A01g002609 [Arachis hypogaea]|uniref:Transposase, Ptta/En/Spm, plant n=1 Tax=Arachis hypogaea TaxID=3818 RepID=A0A445ER07_ARAHY|nr:hypothetical protein Ahy_A01g002609 [Arachis hypogaea]